MKFLGLKNKQHLEPIFRNLVPQRVRWSSLLRKGKPVRAISLEWRVLTLSKLILWCLRFTSTENCHEGLDRHLLKCWDLLPENWQRKTWRIGKFLLVFQTGKTQKVILFLFIWGWEQMADLFSTILSTNTSQTLSTHCISLRDSQSLS